MHSSPSTCAGDFENDSCFLSLYETVMKNILPRLKRLHTCRLYTTVPSSLIIFFFFWKYKCRKMFTNWITCFASGASVIWIATKLGTQKQYWVHDFHRVWMKSEYFFFKFQKNHLNVCLLWIAFYLFAIQGAHMLTPAGEGWIPRVLQVCVLIGVMQWSLLRNGFQAFVKGQRSRRQRLQRESVWCNTFL